MIRGYCVMTAGIGIFCSASGLAWADGPHPFSVHDMLAMERISDHQVSPDGKWIVFVQRTTDLEANKGRTDLWLVGVDGSGLRRLTTHPDADNNPRWAPDGKTVYFISTRSGSPQVWRIAVEGGEAQKVTSEPLEVANLVVSPDGKQIAYNMEVFPDATPTETKERLDKIEKQKATGRIYDHLFIRHWDTWKDGRRSHLFVRALDGKGAVDVTKGLDMDVPTKPFGGPEEIAFTPDCKSIVYTSRDGGREEAWSTDLDLYVVPVDGSAAEMPNRRQQGDRYSSGLFARWQDAGVFGDVAAGI